MIDAYHTVEMLTEVRRARVPAGARPALRRGLRAMVHANVVITLAAVGVALTSCALLGITPTPVLVGFPAGGIFTAYTLNRLWDRTEDATNLPDRTAFVDAYGRLLLLVAGVGYLLATGLLLAVRPLLAPFVALSPIAAWWYSVGPLKHWLLAKNVCVGLGWGCIPLGIGAVAGQPLAPETLATAVLIAWMLLIAAILFDIKDVPGDRLAGVRTLPTVAGVARTRQIAAAGLAAAVPVVLAATLLLDDRFALLFAYVGYLGACIPFARPDRGVLFYGLVIDGEHVLIGAIASVLLVVPGG